MPEVTACHRARCDPSCVEPPAARRSPTRQLLRLVGTVGAATAGAAAIALASAVPGHRRIRRTQWALRHAARWTLTGLGVRLESVGAPRSGPSLVVGNHVSFLDILALAATAPMRQVAKQEVRTWPLIGGLARRTGTLFLRRDRPRELPDLVAGMTAALRSGHRVQVFPEGTTRCGSSLGRFHRAAFQAALNAAVVVTPVALRYTVGGVATRRPAFLGEESLVSALYRVLGQPGITLTLHWLPAVPAIAGTGHDAVDRRRLARRVETAVARELAQPVVGAPTNQRTEPTIRPLALAG